MERFTYRGEWFLPEAPDKTVIGTLYYNPKKSSKLDLVGTLVDFKGSELHEPTIILGLTTKGERITLYKCYQSSSSLFSGIDTCIYTINFILIGNHYKKVEELFFDKVSASFEYLNEFLSVFGFSKVSHDHKNKAISIDYKLPETIKFNLSENLSSKFIFSYSASSSKYLQNVNIVQNSKIEIISNTSLDFNNTLRNISTYQDFITLAALSTASAISINFYKKKKQVESEDNNEFEKTCLYYTPSFKEKQRTIKSSRDFLFNYNDIRENWEAVISKWFAHEEKIAPVIDLLLASFYNSGSFNENKFLNIAQALENFHRRTRNNLVRTKLEHSQMLDEILLSVDSKHKEWLKSRLYFSNEPTLRERLQELINDTPSSILNKITSDSNQLLKDTRNSRNYYTHYDPSSEKKALKGVDLYYLSEKLRLILIIHILFETGLSPAQIEEVFERNHYRFFNHILTK
ncbi:MAG TPA: HEPN domain-containing protein [Hymenobacter sp.]